MILCDLQWPLRSYFILSKNFVFINVKIHLKIWYNYILNKKWIEDKVDLWPWWEVILHFIKKKCVFFIKVLIKIGSKMNVLERKKLKSLNRMINIKKFLLNYIISFISMNYWVYEFVVSMNFLCLWIFCVYDFFVFRNLLCQFIIVSMNCCVYEFVVSMIFLCLWIYCVYEFVVSMNLLCLWIVNLFKLKILLLLFSWKTLLLNCFD